jgi:hypothetical protein
VPHVIIAFVGTTQTSMWTLCLALKMLDKVVLHDNVIGGLPLPKLVIAYIERDDVNH